MAQRFYIIGAGRFGTHLAMRLSEFGCEVIVADRDPEKVKDLAEDGFQTVELDAEDEEALKEAGVHEADAVVVSIGDNMSGSILAALALKQLGIRRIIARALDTKHALVLERVGADHVVLPSRDMAYQLAEQLRANSLNERMPLSGEYQLAHIVLGPRLHGSTLAEARLPHTNKVTVVLISRPEPGQEPEGSGREPKVRDFEPSPDFVVQEGDTLLIVGRRENVDRFERTFGHSTE